MELALPTAVPPAWLENRMDSKRVISWCVIALLHGAFFYALNNGLVNKISVAVPNVITAFMIAEPVQPKEIPKPLPEPKKIVPPMEHAPAPPKLDYTPAPMVYSGQAPARDTAPPAQPIVNAAPAAVAPVAPAQPKTVSGVEYVQAPRPEYPTMSRRKGEEGVVQFRVLVNEQGRAERIEMIKSSDSARLDDAARIAVQNAVFKPYLENGRAVAVYTIVPIRFNLS